MSNLDRIINIKSPPEIGSWFSVPCYPFPALPKQQRNRKSRRKEWEWLCPVLLPAHEDSKLLNFPFWHYHVDFRFFTDNALNKYWENISLIRMDLVEIKKELFNSIQILLTQENTPDYSRIVWRDMMYQRHLPNSTVSLRPLEEAFKNYKLKCLKCPHKGVNLSDRIPDENGIITCPSHGLRFKVK